MPLEKSSDQHNDSIKPNEDKPESVPPKPQILYHGSPNGTITELEPRVAKGSKELGPLVFASDKVSSIAYLAHHHGLALVSQFYEEGVVCAVIKKDRDTFLQKDKGGYLYLVKSDTFHYLMKENEWVSKENVKPVEKIFFIHRPFSFNQQKPFFYE